MDISYTEFVLGGSLFHVSNLCIKLIKDMGKELDDSYFQYLRDRERPAFPLTTDFELSYLIKCDYWNYVLYSAEKGWGQILEYDDSNTVVNKYSSVLDAARLSRSKSKFGFEKLHNKGIIPRYVSTIDFFGLRMEHYNCLDSTVVSFVFKELNTAITRVRYYLFDSRPPQERLAVHKSFTTAYTLITTYRSDKAKKKKDRKQIEESGYRESLLPLFERYTYKEQLLFERVDSLKEFDCPGIYILLFDEYRGYYIGQAKRSIKERVREHFKKPNSDFDRLYGANEVSAIYALRYVSDESKMNELESDCIAMVLPLYLMNCLPDSGKTILSIYGEEYLQTDYLMNRERLSEALKTIYNLRENQ